MENANLKTIDNLKTKQKILIKEIYSKTKIKSVLNKNEREGLFVLCY